jgi:hypothetical protein
MTNQAKTDSETQSPKSWGARIAELFTFLARHADTLPEPIVKHVDFQSFIALCGLQAYEKDFDKEGSHTFALMELASQTPIIVTADIEKQDGYKNVSLRLIAPDFDRAIINNREFQTSLPRATLVFDLPDLPPKENSAFNDPKVVSLFPQIDPPRQLTLRGLVEEDNIWLSSGENDRPVTQGALNWFSYQTRTAMELATSAQSAPKQQATDPNSFLIFDDPQP